MSNIANLIRVRASMSLTRVNRGYLISKSMQHRVSRVHLTTIVSRDPLTSMLPQLSSLPLSILLPQFSRTPLSTLLLPTTQLFPLPTKKKYLNTTKNPGLQTVTLAPATTFLSSNSNWNPKTRNSYNWSIKTTFYNKSLPPN